MRFCAAAVLVAVTACSGNGTAPGHGFAVYSGDQLVDAWDFGAVTVGQTSPTLVLTVKNLGSLVTGVLDIAMRGASATAFDSTGSDCSNVRLTPGSSCTLRLRFAPLDPGVQSATMVLTEDSADVTQLALSGDGQCDVGRVACGGTCIDPTSNGTYCGASGDCQGARAGTTCPTDRTCEGGHCQAHQCDPQAGAICVGADVVPCNADGTLATPTETCGGATVCEGGACVPACGGTLPTSLYGLDGSATTTHELFWIDATTLLRTDIAPVTCPSTGQNPTPYALAVDRAGGGWLLYNTGELFRIDLTTGSCSATGFQRPQGWGLFTMAFVADPSGGAERLIVLATDVSPTRLGVLDTATLQIQTLVDPLAVDSRDAHLTGTGDGKLYLLSGQTRFGANPPAIMQLDPTTGATIGSPTTLPAADTGPCLTFDSLAQYGSHLYDYEMVEQCGSDFATLLLDTDRNTGVYQGIVGNTYAFGMVLSNSTCVAP